jgi:hypothetical protein
MKKSQQLFIFILSTMLLVACNQQAVPIQVPVVETSAVADYPKTPTALQPTPVSDALFQVITADGRIVGFTWDDLKKLPLAQITAEGKVEEGTKVLDILQAAGVTDFIKITLTGTNGSLTIDREQVTDEVILDFTNHGTVKLAAVAIPKVEWIKDIFEIKVE